MFLLIGLPPTFPFLIKKASPLSQSFLETRSLLSTPHELCLHESLLSFALIGNDLRYKAIWSHVLQICISFTSSKILYTPHNLHNKPSLMNTPGGAGFDVSNIWWWYEDFIAAEINETRSLYIHSFSYYSRNPKAGLTVPFMDSVRTPVNSSVPLDPQYRGWVLILVSVVCLPLLLVFVVLRSYVRILTPRSFALDDGKNIHLHKRVSFYWSKLAASLLATVSRILIDSWFAEHLYVHTKYRWAQYHTQRYFFLVGFKT